MLAVPALLLSAGCFSEQAIEVDHDGVAWISACAARDTVPMSTRAWIVRAHTELADLLPEDDRRTLLTENLVGEDGRPVDVDRLYGIDSSRRHMVWDNFRGLLHTAQGRSDGYAIDEPAAPWPGFEDIWIPMPGGYELSARIGCVRRDDEIVEADCIVLLPGLNGDNSVRRTRDIAAALLGAGHHVLAVELRGHGQTEARYPEVYYTFGVLESIDLLALADWLQDKPMVRETGLVGYCWGANIAMITAWVDGCEREHASITARLASALPEAGGERHYRAGILAFSSTIRFEDVIADLHQPWNTWTNPVYEALQENIIHRKERKGFPTRDGCLKKWIEHEFDRTELGYPGGVEDGLRFLKLVPYRGLPAGDKLESVRMPLLIVHGVNDPLRPAQDVAELIAMTENPLVGAIVLPGGGHVGFAPYARDYFYSLLLNYFDPQRGAAACLRNPVDPIQFAASSGDAERAPNGPGNGGPVR